MKYFILLLSGFLLVAVSCTGKNSSDNTKSSDKNQREIKLALMIKRADIYWYRMQIEGFEEECKEQGADYLILDNRMDTNLTLTNIDTLINRRVDGVALAITEQGMSMLIVNRIFEAGIPVISLNNKLIDNQGRQLAPHIGVDYSAAGVTAGKWLSEIADDKSFFTRQNITMGIAELSSDSVMEINTWINNVKGTLLLRSENLNPGIFYTVNSPVNDAAGAMIAMQELLSTHPDVTNWIIYAGSSDKMAGAITALEQVGMSGYVTSISIEAKDSPGIEKYRKYPLRTVLAVDTKAQGRQAARLLIDNIRLGIPIPSVTLSTCYIVQ